MSSLVPSSCCEKPRLLMYYKRSRYISALTLISKASQGLNPRSSNTLPFVRYGFLSTLPLLFILRSSLNRSCTDFPTLLCRVEVSFLRLGRVFLEAMQDVNGIFHSGKIDHAVPLSLVCFLQLENTRRDGRHRPDSQRSTGCAAPSPTSTQANSASKPKPSSRYGTNAPGSSPMPSSSTTPCCSPVFTNRRRRPAISRNQDTPECLAGCLAQCPSHRQLPLHRWIIRGRYRSSRRALSE